MTTKAAATNNDIDKKYQKKTDKEHVLDNPDTYIGSIEQISSNMYIYDEVNKKIVEKNIEFIPGLYKLFDEAIVNCFISKGQLLKSALSFIKSSRYGRY